MSSAQTKHVWKRFGAWYGADVLERKYGLQPPEDWARAIDAIHRNHLDAVLVDVRTAHPVWPPTLHEFEQLAKPKPAGRSAIDRLDEHLRGLSLTFAQARGITYIGNSNEITGARIPNSDGTGTFRIMLRDLGA
jgi:hypothetical protein